MAAVSEEGAPKPEPLLPTMLWLDETLKAPPAVLLREAIACYQHRYGLAPSLAYLHPQHAGLTHPYVEIRYHARVGRHQVQLALPPGAR